MPRKTAEWIGKTPDTKVPDRVRVRVFEFYDGVCQLCTAPILLAKDYVTDHRYPLISGGANRETNLQPVHEWCHKLKTAQDVAFKAKAYRVKRRIIVGPKPRSMTRWRRFNGTVVVKPRWR